MHPKDASRHDTPAPARLAAEPLRDQIFAACGYAFAVAAVVVGLLLGQFGGLGLVSGLVLAAVLVPVNVVCIRRFARLRRRLAAQFGESVPAERRPLGR